MAITPLVAVDNWAEPENSRSKGEKKTAINEIISTINEIITQLGSQNELGELTDVTISSPADNEVLAYDDGTSEWINQTAAEAGLELAFSKNTAFNKNFGTGTSNVVEIGSALGNSQVVLTDASGKLLSEAEQTGHNLVLGTGSGQVAEGDHNHDADYINETTISETELIDRLSFGSAKKNWFNTILIGANNDSKAVKSGGGLAKGTGVFVVNWEFECVASTVLSSLSFYIDEWSFYLQDADADDKITQVRVYGMGSTGTGSLIYDSGAVSWTSAGAKSDTFTVEDCSSYLYVYMLITVSTTTPSHLSLTFPRIKGNYA